MREKNFGEGVSWTSETLQGVNTNYKRIRLPPKNIGDPIWPPEHSIP